MSVCVSSSLNTGMSHASHLHLTSTLSMMQPFQSHHQMASSSSALASGLDLSHAQQTSQQLQMQNSSSSSSSDANDPNPEMLLALIARNKTLEGEFSCAHRYCRRKKNWREWLKLALDKLRMLVVKQDWKSIDLAGKKMIRVQLPSKRNVLMETFIISKRKENNLQSLNNIWKLSNQLWDFLCEIQTKTDRQFGI